MKNMSPAAIKDGINIIRSRRRYEFFMKYGLAQLSYVASSRMDRGINIIIFISSIRCTTFCDRLTDHNNFILPLEQAHKMYFKVVGKREMEYITHFWNKALTEQLSRTKLYKIVSNKKRKMYTKQSVDPFTYYEHILAIYFIDVIL